MANYSSQNVESSLTLSSGDTAKSLNVMSGGKLIVSGGLADQTRIYESGNATVIAGGVMNTIGAFGGLVNILSNGLASNVTLASKACMNVLSAGSGAGISVNNGGILDVSSGGRVSGTTITDGGILLLAQGTTASDVTVFAGGSVGKFKQINGSVTINEMKDGAIAGTITGMDMIGDITAVEGARFNAGEFASGTLLVKGGFVSGVTIGISGTMKASSTDLTISNTHILSGGRMQLNGSAQANAIQVYSSGGINNFTHVGNNIAVVSAVVGKDIMSGASGIVFDGTMHLGKGAVANNTTVHDGVLFVSAGASANKLVISKGSASIMSGAFASAVEIYDDTYLRIAHGATAANLALASGGKVLDIEHAGYLSAGKKVVASIESAYASGIGGRIHNLHLIGDANVLYDATALGGTNVTDLIITEDGNATFNSKVSASGVTIESEGMLTVKSDAEVEDIAVAEGGILNISSGASVEAIDLSAGAYLNMEISGNDTETYVTGINESGAFSYINGTASNFIIYEGQHFVISSGGSARNLKITQGAVVSAAMGADVSGYSTDMKMSFSILGSAISGLTNLSNFELGIGYGYAVDGQKLYNGGVQYVTSGGLANKTTINEGGEIRVGYNGSAWNVYQSAGGKISLDVYNSASLTSVTGSRIEADDKVQVFAVDKGVASNFMISSGAYLNIHNGGEAIETTIASGGKLIMSSGGTATKITLNKGAIISADIYGNDSATVLSATYDSAEVKISKGIAANLVLNSDARVNINLGGTANNTTVNNDGLLFVNYQALADGVNITGGGEVFVGNQGCAADVQIRNGGELTLAAGAVLDGTITVAGNLNVEGVVSFIGQVITIDVTSRTPDMDDPMIDNISFITDAVFEINVDTSANADYFFIASGALGFPGEIVLNDENANYLGTFSAENRSIKSGQNVYTIETNSAGDLFLSVDDVATSAEKFYAIGNFNTYDTYFSLSSDGTGTIRNKDDVITLNGTLDPSKWSLLGAGDFDRNGVDGLLWMENSTGEVYMQNNMTGFDEVNNKTYCLGTIGKGYTPLAVGDFTGTGFDGILMQGPAFGDASVSLNYGLPVWGRENDGTTFAGWLGALVNTWQPGNALKGNTADLDDINAKNYMYEVVAVGDFNGDGVDDVMLQNIMPETVNGVQITGSGDVFTFLTGSLDDVKEGTAPTVAYTGCAAGAWEIIGTGDFDNDGIDDVLLSDGTNIAGWKMANGQRAADFVFDSLANDQKFAGIGDFDNDGTDDILLMDSTTEKLFAWRVENGAVNGMITLA